MLKIVQTVEFKFYKLWNYKLYNWIVSSSVECVYRSPAALVGINKVHPCGRNVRNSQVFVNKRDRLSSFKKNELTLLTECAERTMLTLCQKWLCIVQ